MDQLRCTILDRDVVSSVVTTTPVNALSSIIETWEPPIEEVVEGGRLKWWRPAMCAIKSKSAVMRGSIESQFVAPTVIAKPPHLLLLWRSVRRRRRRLQDYSHLRKEVGCAYNLYADYRQCYCVQHMLPALLARWIKQKKREKRLVVLCEEKSGGVCG